MHSAIKYLTLLIIGVLIFVTGMLLYDNNSLPDITEPTITSSPAVAKVIPECMIDMEGDLIEISQSSNLYCIFSIESGIADATLKVSSTSIEVLKNEQSIIVFNCGSADEYYWYECDFGAEAISLLDVTNDGYADIRLKNECGAYQCAYTYYIFDVPSNQYVRATALSGVIEPSFDPLIHTIYSHAKARGIGDMFVNSKYTLDDSGQYQLIETCSQDMIDWGTEQSDYLYVCQEFRDGVLATSTQETIPYVEVWGE